MIALSSVTSSLKAAKSIQAFVEGGILSTILSAIGDVEYRAAARVLRKLNEASNQRERVLSAINHLETSHIAYSTDINRMTGIIEYVRGIKRMSVAKKDVFTLCILAICYKYTGELTLMRESLDQAKEVLNIYPKMEDQTIKEIFCDKKHRSQYVKALTSIIPTYFTPGILKEIDDTPTIYGADFEAFQAELLSKVVAEPSSVV